MSLSDYIPRTDDSLSLWLANFKTKLAIHAATVGVTPADLAIYQSECDTLVAAITTVDQARANLKQLVSSKDGTRSDTVGNIRSLAARIKTNAAYTEAIGNDLGIIGSATVIDYANAKPALTVSTSGGQVIVVFKKGPSNGVKLYGRRGSEANFSFLALDTHSPYHDNRPNVVANTPELREYYAFFIDNFDEQYGLQSDIVSITV